MRNIHNIVFGGYLIQEAFELAFLAGSLFFQTAPTIRRMDDLHFVHPVPIGSILDLSAEVVWTSGGSSPSPSSARDAAADGPVQQAIVDVQADVVEVATGIRKTTNTFHFLLEAPTTNVRKQVYPETYLEGLKYLAAQRFIDQEEEINRISV